MSAPLTTRLRYVRAAEPGQLSDYLAQLKFRVQIYGAPVWDGTAWTLWFVPPDDSKIQIGNADLTAL